MYGTILSANEQIKAKIQRRLGSIYLEFSPVKVWIILHYILAICNSHHWSWPSACFNQHYFWIVYHPKSQLPINDPPNEFWWPLPECGARQTSYDSFSKWISLQIKSCKEICAINVKKKNIQTWPYEEDWWRHYTPDETLENKNSFFYAYTRRPPNHLCVPKAW